MRVKEISDLRSLCRSFGQKIKVQAVVFRVLILAFTCKQRWACKTKVAKCGGVNG